MSEILNTITLQPVQAAVVIEPNTITVNPEPINLTINSFGGSATGSSAPGELLYNNNYITGGVANTNYANGNLSLGDASNVKITGGVNTYFLQTDGTGNLTWAAGAGNITGNGVPGGANTQIQFNDGGANFGGAAGFTFDKVSNVMTAPGNVSIANYVISNNAVLGNAVTANYFIGNLYGNANTAGTVTVNAQPNITQLGNLLYLNVTGASNLNNIGNLTILGGNTDDVIKTDGNGALSFTVKTNPWSNSSSMPINSIFIGKGYGFANAARTGPGNLLTTNSTPNFSSWTTGTAGVGGNIGHMNGNGTVIYAATVTGNSVAYTTNGESWTVQPTPLKPARAPQQGLNNLVIYATSTNRAAYSTNFGSTWSNVTLPNSGLWQDIAYGNGTFIICTSQPGYNYVAISTDEGLTWSQSAVGNPANTNPSWTRIAYGNSKFMVGPAAGGGAQGAISSDNGGNWTLLSGLNQTTGLAYGNGIWVSVKGNSIGGTATVKFSSDDGNTWSTGTITNKSWTQCIYNDPYFVTCELLGNGIAYSTDGNNWSYGNTNNPSGYLGVNAQLNAYISSNPAGNISIDITQPTILVVDNSDGTGPTEKVPNGTYRNLGGIDGNVGALWMKVS